MYEWSDEHLMLRDAMRRFVEARSCPTSRSSSTATPRPTTSSASCVHVRHGRHGPRPVQAPDRPTRRPRPTARRPSRTGAKTESGGGDAGSMTLIPIIELCRYCPGMVTAMGVSVGLTAARHHVARAPSRRRSAGRSTCSPSTRSAPGPSPSPARAPTRSASMKATARRDGDEYVLNGTKTFITNGPYADTIVFICKLDEGNDARASARCSPSCSTRACRASSSRKPLRKMGMHSSPTGELFLDRRARRAATACSARPRSCQPAVATAPRRRSPWSAPASPRWRSASSSSASSCRVRVRQGRGCSSASPSASSS